MNFISIFLWLTMVMLGCSSFAQTEEILCLKSFNSSVHQILLSSKKELDVSSENVKLIFELYISECGRVDSINLKKSNLSTLGIDEAMVVSSIEGKVFPCLRNVYYNGKLIPDNVIISYNSKFLLDNK